MRKTSIRIAGSVLALAALAQPLSARAQDCVAQADIADGIVYFMPAISEAVSAQCAGALSPDGYLAMRGGEFADGFIGLQDAAWPGALRFLGQFAEREASGMGELLDQLPPEALRPFVDAIVVQKVGEMIKPQDCGKIERAMELIAPLPPENTADLVAFIASLTNARNPEICAETGE